MRNFLFYLTCLLIVYGCQKDDILEPEIENSNQNSHLKAILPVYGDETVLGRQLENPYSVSNMKAALADLQQSSLLKSVSTLEIQTTHLYVRFLPKDDAELDVIKSDESIELYDYPLDYELLNEGICYHDSSLPEDQITWQYTCVPIGYVFPNVKYEVLSELFLIEDSDDGLKSATISLSDWEILEDNALKLTGNEDGTVTLKSSKWTPSGRIMLYDDDVQVITRVRVFSHYEYKQVLCTDPNCDYLSYPLKASVIEARRLPIDYEPHYHTEQVAVYKYEDKISMGGNRALVGAKVRARRWFTIHRGITDSNGYFTCDGRFRRRANYSIKWERKYWDIRSGTWGQAYYNGPKKSGSWYLNISGGKSLHYAAIHQAAYRHFYGNNLGMKRPVRKPYGKWKICYYDKEGTGDFWGGLGGGLLPNIRIFGYENGNYKTTQKVFRTAAHEIGHAGHCANMGNIQFWQVSKIIYESWADAVEWALTLQEYDEINSPITDYNRLRDLDKQNKWPINSAQKEYSPLFIDLVDNYNQRNYNISLPNDNVTGYSMSQLFNIVTNSYGLSSLKSNLKANKPYNVTDKQIDDLFLKYEEVW